jgi:hypothetical protein
VTEVVTSLDSLDPTVRQLVDELANALQSVVLIAERLELETASASIDARDMMNGLRRAKSALDAVRAVDRNMER